MNSTSELPDYLRQYLASLSNAQSYFPLVILAIIFSVFLLAVIVFVLIKSNRTANRFYRILFRMATDHDSSTRTVASPNARGQFQPPVWCNTCNDHIDHVENMCPHVGRKLYACSQSRLMYRSWYRQLQQRYQATDQPKPKIDPAIARTNTNITIDLDELIGQGIARKPSTSSIESIPGPCQASTPDRLQHRFRRHETRLDRVRNKLRAWTSRRRVSSESSGIGSSLGSSEDVGPQMQTTFIDGTAQKPRRWVSDLTGLRPAPPIPKIVVHRCSSRRRPRIPAGVLGASSDLLRVNVAWNGPQKAGSRSGNGLGYRRAFSHPGDESDRAFKGFVRSLSTGAAPIHLSVYSNRQQPFVGQPVVVHSPACGHPSNSNNRTGLGVDSPNRSFAEVL